MKRSLPILFALAAPAFAEPPDIFAKDVLPILEEHCFHCHEGSRAKADVNLEEFATEADVWKNPKLWEKVFLQLRDKQMPPPKRSQPSEEHRAQVLTWLEERLENPDPAKFPKDPGHVVIRRLSALEYNSTVRDLLGVDIRPADSFPPDGGGGGGFDNNASTLFLPPVLLEKYLEAADAVLAAAKAERLFPESIENGDERAAAQANLHDLARRAFRRPPEQEEIDRLARIYEAARRRGEGYDEAVRLAARGILISPNFLFRIEPERPGAEPYRVNDWELASRLSYFIWSSMPDEELFRVAGEGRLAEPAVLEEQVRRMLADPKARTFAESFASQWLRTKELYTVVSPASSEFTPQLRDAFYNETLEFLHGLLRDNRSLVECLDADYTYANETLAKFYGLPEVTGDAMQRVALKDRNRGGVLGMGGVLTLTSYPRRTSPVLRGRWVMEEILGTPPPPPPPQINTQSVNRRNRELTFRQRLEEHRKDPNCASCHARMDPLGFGLENFDAIGAWRTEEGSAPVDASGQLVTGEKFEGPAELKRLLVADKDVFIRNITEKMLAYALGRGMEAPDWIHVRQIAQRVAEDGDRAQTLVLEIARSFPFQYRRPGQPASVAQNTP